MASICYKPRGSCETCEHSRPDPDYYNGTVNCCWEKKHPVEFQKILAEIKTKEVINMAKFIVHFEKVFSYDVEVKARNEEEAQEIATEIICKEQPDINPKVDKQEGYIEYCYTDKIDDGKEV